MHGGRLLGPGGEAPLEGFFRCALCSWLRGAFSSGSAVWWTVEPPVLGVAQCASLSCSPAQTHRARAATQHGWRTGGLDITGTHLPNSLSIHNTSGPAPSHWRPGMLAQQQQPLLQGAPIPELPLRTRYCRKTVQKLDLLVAVRTLR